MCVCVCMCVCTCVCAHVCVQENISSVMYEDNAAVITVLSKRNVIIMLPCLLWQVGGKGYGIVEVGSHFATHNKLLFDSFKTTHYVIIANIFKSSF